MEEQFSNEKKCECGPKSGIILHIVAVVLVLATAAILIWLQLDLQRSITEKDNKILALITSEETGEGEGIKGFFYYYNEFKKRSSVGETLDSTVVEDLTMVHQVTVNNCPEEGSDSEVACAYFLEIYGPSDWDNLDTRTFYLAEVSAGLSVYYGPFEDSMKRIVDEVMLIRELTEL